MPPKLVIGEKISPEERMAAQKAIDECHVELEKQNLRSNLSGLKSKSKTWRVEFEAGNDSNQILDLLVRHGSQAQVKTRETHRAEGFLSLSELNELKKLNESGKSYNKNQSNLNNIKQRFNTHQKAVNNIRVLGRDVDPEFGLINESDSHEMADGQHTSHGDHSNTSGTTTTTNNNIESSGPQGPPLSVYDEKPDWSNMTGKERSRWNNRFRKDKTPRVMSVFGGYDLSMSNQTKHPLQQLVLTRDFGRFKNIEHRNTEDQHNIDDHIYNRYLKNNEFDGNSNTKMWPHVHFLRLAEKDTQILQMVNYHQKKATLASGLSFVPPGSDDGNDNFTG